MGYTNYLLIVSLLLCHYSLSVKGGDCRVECLGSERAKSNPTCLLKDNRCRFSTSTLRSQNITEFNQISVLIDFPNVDNIRIWNSLGIELRIGASAYNDKLTSLQLNGAMYYIRPDLFFLFPNLKDLLLGSARLEYFPYLSRSNQFLTRIHIDFRTSINPTKTLRSGHVSGLRDLKRLSIIHSSGLNLTDQTFSGLTALTLLFVKRCHIPNPATTFSPLVRLKKLYYRSSGLTNVSFLSQTPSLHGLTFLSFYKNRISSIPAISNYHNLEKLSLDSNRISRIENKWSNNGAALVTLNLNFNPISHLSSRMFEYLPNLTAIYLTGLPLHCDCGLQWMSIVSLKLYSSRCSTPPQHSGKRATYPSIYVNCTQELSYQCFNRSNSCPTGSYCQDTLDSYTCVCEEENYYFIKHLNKCVNYEQSTTTSTQCITSTQCTCPPTPTCPTPTCTTPTCTTPTCPTPTCTTTTRPSVDVHTTN